jgi:hypothetical protein
MAMPRVNYLLAFMFVSCATAWPFGQGGKASDGQVARPQAGAADALGGLADVSAEELQQAQAMMNDPAFMKQMLGQLKDPDFMSQLKASLESPEARATMEKMGLRVPSEEEVAEAMAKLESPEFQAQLRARAEAAAAAYSEQGGSKMQGSRLSRSKVDQSSGHDTPVLGAA